jgi:hypothetical protein
VNRQYRKFNGLFRCDPHELRHKATIQAGEAFVPDDLLEAVEAVPVHQLADVSTRSLKVEVD